MSRAGDITAGLHEVRARIAAAESAAQRPPGSVRLLAVSKRMPADDVLSALRAGQEDFGESYAQEFRDKRPAVAGLTAAAALPSPRWHYIGPLQSNKIKYVAGKVALLHSVDSIAVLEQIDRHVASVDPAAVQACLVQVNVAGETQKHGVAPTELPALLDAFAALAHVRCDGFMLIPPLGEEPEASRPHFVALRRLRDTEAARPRPHVDLRELSMGMSDDLEIAVAAGATMVRVGTAIFGARVLLP